MVSSDPRDWSEYEAYARRLRDSYQVPGVAVAVAQEGKTSYAGGLGWRDREKDLPVTEDTVFGVGSITKSFTAIAILQLAEEGKLSLEDPVTGLDIEILGPPGAMLSYSNDAFALLGTIVERVSGRKYETFVGERILDPLEMRHSTFDLGAVAAYPDVTVLYVSRPVKAGEGARRFTLPRSGGKRRPWWRRASSART